MNLEYLKNKEIVIYGAGYAGKVLSNYLLNKGLKVTSIMVSPGIKN